MIAHPQRPVETVLEQTLKDLEWEVWSSDVPLGSGMAYHNDFDLQHYTLPVPGHPETYGTGYYRTFEPVDDKDAPSSLLDKLRRFAKSIWYRILFGKPSAQKVTRLPKNSP